MELKEALQLEQYKFVMDRQRYFTELARDAFASYAKLFSGLSAGIVALISAKEKLELPSNVLGQLLIAVLLLVTFLGLVASAQIAFCLARWRHFRSEEATLNPHSPPLHRSWWLFETLYVVAIFVAVVVAWIVFRGIPI